MPRHATPQLELDFDDPPSGVYQSLPDRPRFTTDRAGIVADANLEACLMIDLGRRYLIGKRLSLLVHRPDVTRVDHVLRALATERRVDIGLHLRDRVGRVRPVRIRAELDGADRVIWSARSAGRAA